MKNLLTLFALLCTTTFYAQIDVLETFEDGQLPTNWNGNGDYAISTTDTCGTSTYVLASSSTTGYFETETYFAFLDDFNSSSDLYVTVDFGANGSNVPSNWGNIEMYYSNDEGITWDLMGEPYTTANPSCTTFSRSVDRYQITSSVKFRIKNNKSVGSYNVYFDNVRINQAPPCIDTSLTFPANTDIEIDIQNPILSWYAPDAYTTGYILTVKEVGVANYVRNLNQRDIGNVTSYDLGILDADTEYYAWIASYSAFGETECNPILFTTQKCPMPTGVGLGEIGDASVEFIWDYVDNTLSNVTLFVQEQGNPAPDDTTPATEIVNVFFDNPQSAYIDNLTPDTYYEAYLSVTCDVDNGWVGPFYFNTECGNIYQTPYLQDFNGHEALQGCWQQGDTNAEDWIVANTAFTGSSSSPSGGNYAYVSDSAPHSFNTVVETPLINVSNLTTPALSFYYYSYSNGGVVTLSVDFYDGTNWNNNIFINNTNTEINGERSWLEAIVDLSSYTITGPVKLRFVVDETNGTSLFGDALIDDIAVNELEAFTCKAPEVSFEFIRDTYAKAVWSPQNNETSWEYVVVPAGSQEPTSGTIINEAFITFYGLTVFTDYDFYLRPICTAENGIWEKVSFQTQFYKPGDDLCDAIPLIVNNPGTAGEYTHNSATREFNTTQPYCFDSSITSDMWFSFVAPPSGDVTISGDLGGTEIDNEMALFLATGVDCTNLYTLDSPVACDNGGLGSDYLATIVKNNLNPGETYYVQVDRGYFTESPGSFGIEVIDNEPVISMVGTALNGWPSDGDQSLDVVMTKTAEGIYEAQDITFGSGLMKFRTNYDWTQTSYGGDAFPIGAITSTDISVTNGIYDVTLNLNSNTYEFVLDTSSSVTIGLVGPGANGWPDGATPDILLTTTNGVNYQLLNQVLNTGDVKFRQDQEWTTSWGSLDFPIGIGSTDNGPNIPVIEGTYNIYFNLSTGDYNFESTSISVTPKVFLQGAGLNRSTVSGEENWMRDDLRVANLIPTASPYEPASISAGVLDVTGADAIVDWVLVEFRDENDNTSILSSIGGLVQRDGDVVATDGVSPIQVPLTAGNYFIAVKHRNHLAVVIANTLGLTNVATNVNFTNATNPITFGTNAQTTFGMPTDVLALWAGNAGCETTSTKYQGSGNDSNAIKDAVLAEAGNASNSNLYSFTGYNNADVNMDGTIKYQGSVNDSNTIKDIILSHSANASASNLFTVEEQLPEHN